MSMDYKALFLGRIEKILIEEEAEIDGVKYQIGHNERYLKFGIRSDENLINRIIQVKSEKMLTDEILLCSIQQ
jgi:hypothetical protein